MLLFRRVCHQVSTQADKLDLLAIFLLLANVSPTYSSGLHWAKRRLIKKIARRSNLSACCVNDFGTLPKFSKISWRMKICCVIFGVIAYFFWNRFDGKKYSFLRKKGNFYVCKIIYKSVCNAALPRDMLKRLPFSYTCLLPAKLWNPGWCCSNYH